MPEAPGALALVERFVNTIDLESGQEELDAPHALGTWASAQGVPIGRAATTEDLRATVEFREAVRGLLLANHDDEGPPEAVPATIERFTADAPLRVHVDGAGRSTLVPAGEGPAVLFGTVLAAIHEGAVDGTLPRLKVCPERTCQWAFYDRSRNRCRSWCSMAVCGNRNKVKAYRTRIRAADDPAG